LWCELLFFYITGFYSAKVCQDLSYDTMALTSYYASIKQVGWSYANQKVLLGNVRVLWLIHEASLKKSMNMKDIRLTQV